MLVKLARVMVLVIAAEDFAIATAFAASGQLKVAGFWAAIGVTNILASTMS